MEQTRSSDEQGKKNGLKIVSLILALLLWFYVVNEGSFRVGQNNVAVDLLYDNLQEGIQVQGPEQVTIKLWGVFQETGEIQAHVDLAGKGPGVYTLPVKLKPVVGVLFTSVEPKTVNVTLEELQEIIVPVNYNIIAQAPAGYQLKDLLTEPEHCLVKGDQEQALRVASVVCQVDLSHSKSINTFELRVRAHDKDGNPVDSGLEIIPAVVKVIAVVDEIKAYKEVPIMVFSEGQPAAGYQLKNIRLDTSSVQIVGSSLAVETVKEINTGKIDINEVAQSFSLKVELQAPEGIKLYPSQVMAEVEIEKIVEDEELQ